MTAPGIYLSAPDMYDTREPQPDAFDPTWIAPLGPHADGFERDVATRAGLGHAAGLSSGTAGSDLDCVWLMSGPLIAPWRGSTTFVGSVSPIFHLGAETAHVESEPATWNLRRRRAERCVTGDDNVERVVEVRTTLGFS